MSARTRDERLNEVADRILELLDYFISRCDTGCDYGKCKWCEAFKLIEWVNEGK